MEKMTNVLHEPQLDTILMVEKAIRESKSYPTKKELLKSLPKQVQFQTLNRILEYLESSNKIVFDGRRIIWVFPDNPKLKELLEKASDFNSLGGKPLCKSEGQFTWLPLFI